mmetsp:Transcript_65151/g.115932  ORF Transcript_65151/g.115932 Transcript_65151/m.115932 type:complete len:305 (+) Transcript_65151:243-1157(+)
MTREGSEAGSPPTQDRCTAEADISAGNVPSGADGYLSWIGGEGGGFGCGCVPLEPPTVPWGPALVPWGLPLLHMGQLLVPWWWSLGYPRWFQGPPKCPKAEGPGSGRIARPLCCASSAGARRVPALPPFLPAHQIRDPVPDVTHTALFCTPGIHDTAAAATDWPHPPGPLLTPWCLDAPRFPPATLALPLTPFLSGWCTAAHTPTCARTVGCKKTHVCVHPVASCSWRPVPKHAFYPFYPFSPFLCFSPCDRLPLLPSLALLPLRTLQFLRFRHAPGFLQHPLPGPVCFSQAVGVRTVFVNLPF